MTKFEFQTGDKVLARYDEDTKWEFHHFSHNEGDEFSCDGWTCQQCIPYNETTKHPCGTSNPYIGPAESPAFEFGDVVKWDSYYGVTYFGILVNILDTPTEMKCIVASKDGYLHNIKLTQLRLIRKGNFND